jgi:hypothetical protein
VRGLARTEKIECNIPILQNDTLSVFWGSWNGGSLNG